MLIKSPKSLDLSRRKLLAGAAALAAFSRLEQAEAQTPCGNFYPLPPAPAAAAGFTRLVFSDDFDVAGTIGPSTASSGYNWYLWNQCNASLASNATVNTTQTAAQISNGNTSGGSFASASGGILKLLGPQCNSGNITLTSISQSGTGGPGNIYGGYIEAYLQFNPNISANGNWVAWWMNATNRISYQGFSQVWTENDIVEAYDNNFGFPATGAYSSCKEWGEQGSNSVACAGQYLTGSPGNNLVNFTQDKEWHKFAILWQTNGGPSTTATGTISYWLDDVQRYTWNNGTPKNSFTTGPNGDAGARYMNFSPQTLFLGGPFGTGAELYVDYVNVWQ